MGRRSLTKIKVCHLSFYFIFHGELFWNILQSISFWTGEKSPLLVINKRGGIVTIRELKAVLLLFSWFWNVWNSCFFQERSRIFCVPGFDNFCPSGVTKLCLQSSRSAKRTLNFFWKASNRLATWVENWVFMYKGLTAAPQRFVCCCTIKWGHWIWRRWWLLQICYGIIFHPNPQDSKKDASLSFPSSHVPPQTGNNCDRVHVKW